MGNAAGRMKKRGHRELVVFGRRAVREALAQAPADLAVEQVWISRSAPAALRAELEPACRARGLDLRVVSDAEVHALSRQPRHDQGVAAAVCLGRVCEVEAFLERRTGRDARDPVRLLALDGITNAQNVGMVVRSVVGCGLDGLLWPRIGSPWIDGLVIKASASAIYRCNVLRCDLLVAGLLTLQGAGFRVVGLVHPGEGDLFDYAVPHRAVFVAGSETRGLSREVSALCDARLGIPLPGPVESLNVAVAASLACYKAAGLVCGSSTSGNR